MKEILNKQSIKWKPANVKGFSSHQILDEHGGTLKYLRIESGAHYPLHTHPDKTEYAQVLEGSAIITLGEKQFIAEQGEVIIFPESTPHAIGNATENECVLLLGAIKTN